MKRNWQTLKKPYQKALNHYLMRASAARLKPALALGHQAVALGLETLDLAMLHEHALLALLDVNSTLASQRRVILKARDFFAESIIAMEETHRSALESNKHLIKLNRSLSKRTAELATSNQQLKKEITRRQVVEKTLRQSERYSSRLLNQSQNLQEQMRLLSHRVLSVQEEERKRISRELHDVIAQILTGINVQLAALKLDATANTRGLGKKILSTQRLVEKSVDIIHRFARELRPAVLDDLGLMPAIHSYAKKFSKETGIPVHMTTYEGVESLNSANRTVFYRVAQEALTNIGRHARASQVNISIREYGETVSIIIRDNGRSFDVQKVLNAKKSKRLGLLGMRERVEMLGGAFSVESAPGKGTTIRANIPLNHRIKGKERT